MEQKTVMVTMRFTLDYTHDAVKDIKLPVSEMGDESWWKNVDEELPDTETTHPYNEERLVSGFVVCYHPAVPFLWVSWREAEGDGTDIGFGEVEHNGESYEPIKWAHCDYLLEYA